jgi:hypothetical protein
MPSEFEVTPMILPTPDGPIETSIISVPVSAFNDLHAWDGLGDFEPLDWQGSSPN